MGVPHGVGAHEQGRGPRGFAVGHRRRATHDDDEMYTDVFLDHGDYFDGMEDYAPHSPPRRGADFGWHGRPYNRNTYDRDGVATVKLTIPSFTGQ